MQGISVKKFEECCGLANGTVSKLSEKSRPSTFDRICASFPINREWLLEGKGEMIVEQRPGVVNSQYNGNNSPHVQQIQGEVNADTLLMLRRQIEAKDAQIHKMQETHAAQLAEKDKQISRLLDIIAKGEKVG